MEPPQYSTAFLIRRTGSPSGRRRARVSATSRKQWLRLRTRYRKGLKVCSLLASLTRPARYSVATASSRSRKTLVRICSNECYPPITVRLESCQVDGKPVLAVIVPHSPQRPHFSGHAFRRVGSQNIKSDEAAYSDFITARSSVGAKILENRGKVVNACAPTARNSVILSRWRRTSVNMVSSQSRHVIHTPSPFRALLLDVGMSSKLRISPCRRSRREISYCSSGIRTGRSHA